MSQLSLFDLRDEVAKVLATSAPCPPSHARTDGCGRLMRALIRKGLPEDAWLSAAALVIALDAEAPVRTEAGTVRTEAGT